MGRLIDWPVGLGWTSREPLSGPRSVGGGSSTGSTGFEQTFASPFGLWRWQFSLPPLNGAMFRRYRGMVTSLHGGANAVRVPFRDPDALTFSDIGGSPSPNTLIAGVPWVNGKPWGNGKNWRPAMPVETVTAAASAGDTTVVLGTTTWGGKVGIGDMIGFVGQYGLYVVTCTGSTGLTIWPPLRANVAANSYATLKPVMAMRLEGESGANLGRSTFTSSSLTITLIEVEHQDVIDFFGG